MIIANQDMIAAMDKAERIHYYPWCTDLTLAGENYKVNEIVCFVRTASDPLSDFIQVKKYDDSFLLILLYTEDTSLIAECMEYVDTIKNDYEEIELRTPYAAVLQNASIQSRYTFTEPEYPPSPIYEIHSSDALLPHIPNKEVSVTLYRESDKEEIAEAIAAETLDSESMHPDMFVPCTVFRDTKWYILRVGREIAGYLRAECGYANIYDIGWLYVEPRFRGHGYAVDLVMHFSKDMFSHGAIPHYGYAISDASERVAQKCGYITDTTRHFFYRLLPL